MPSLFPQQYPTADSFDYFSYSNVHIYSSKHSAVQQSAAPGGYNMEHLCAGEEAAAYHIGMVKEDSESHFMMPDAGFTYDIPIHPAHRRSNDSVEQIVPDAGVPFDSPIHPSPRRSDAGVEHWFASESPVTPATDFNILQPPTNPVPHELPFHSTSRQSNASVDHWLTLESPVAQVTNFSTPQQPTNPYRLPSLPGTTLLPDSCDYSVDVKQNAPTMEEIAMQDMPYEQVAQHLHISEVDNIPRNISPPTLWKGYDEYYSASSPATPIYSRRDLASARGIGPPASTYSSPGFIDDSPMYSPCSSAPDLYRPASAEGHSYRYSGVYAAGFQTQIPRSFPDRDRDQVDEEEIVGGKPYAQLIQECLLQAPANRMMLRDIYEWFERNTSKPRESGGNGWQNSIRHNLSMNKAFENDKTTVTNARGEPKKATSIWYLTDHALRHGVQSTTRYRKNNHGRKSAYNRHVDWKRQSSGSRGGKASRKATQMRRLGVGAWSTYPPSEELGSFDHLLRAANIMSDHPGTRGSSPMSPPENYPCTPRTPMNHEYPTSMAGGFGCHGDDLSFHEVQLQDAIFQATYGSSPEVMW